MTRCPHCQSEILPRSISCSACGASLADSFSPTQRVDPKAPSEKRDRQSPSYDSIDNARFVPGTLVAERYRIMGLLGKGGMGEVYRADDLKLGQPVALKFLPEKLLLDAESLSRFHREVRVARQVSHKNVCRVYDIGETGGHHFLSMEFIKGEELSSLLRRIGRVPADKAIQLARQICAGLAAAHENGVLHRDLKPSNVMIDSDGNARITDFGLAGLAGEFRDDEYSAGTPAYMAPEQLAGKDVSVKSDIYSLGLVLYELFTGKRAFDAGTLGELMRLRQSDTTPTSPSEIVKDIDPVIERVIDRCLQKDPLKRPSSALHVAAALPGGDPIAAALAAGETPSPEMVAAAPKEGALRPSVASSLFIGLMIGLAFVVFFADKVLIHGYVPLDKSPDALQERAQEIVRKTGHSMPVTDTMRDFAVNTASLDQMSRTDPRPERWQDLKDGQPAVIVFWYRQSPTYFDGFDYFRDRWSNPAPTLSGMAGVRLDSKGRLLHFYSVPPQVDPVTQPSDQSSDTKSSDTTFQALFAEAGFDIANFKPTTSIWAPLYMNDRRMAWEGVYPEQKTISVRVEAASYRGQPVYFEVVNPWDAPERQHPPGLPVTVTALFTLLLSVFMLVLIGSVLLAIRNLRLGRGDLKGALRLAIFVFTFTELSRLFSGHHVPTFAEFATVFNGLQDSVFAAAFFCVVYLALEPFVRRRWPHRIISWTRLLGGNFRDPMVGRDILIGAAFGMGIATWQLFFYFVRRWLGDIALQPALEPGVQKLGMDHFVESLTAQLTTPLLNGFQLLFLVLLLALLFRRDWLGFAIGWLLFTVGLALAWGGALPNWLSAAITAGLITFVLFRYGLLATMATIFFLHMYIQFPVTIDLTAWYARGFVMDLIIVLTLAVYAFHTSLAGQSPFGGKLLED